MGCSSYDVINYEPNENTDYLTRTIAESIKARQRAQEQAEYDAKKAEMERLEKEYLRQQYLLNCIDAKGPKSYVDNLIQTLIPKMKFGTVAPEEEIVKDLNDRDCEEYKEGEEIEDEEIDIEELKKVEEKNQNEIDELKRQIEEMNKKEDEENNNNNKKRERKKGGAGFFGKKEGEGDNDEEKNEEKNIINEEKDINLGKEEEKIISQKEGSKKEKKSSQKEENAKKKKNKDKKEKEKKISDVNGEESIKGSELFEKEKQISNLESIEGEGEGKKKKDKNKKKSKRKNKGEQEEGQEEPEEKEEEEENKEDEEKKLREKIQKKRNEKAMAKLKALMELKIEKPPYKDLIKKYKYPKKKEEQEKLEFPSTPTELHICVIGEGGSGKTSFVKKYTSNVFEKDTQKTEKIESYDEIEAEFDSKKIKLIVLDTPPLSVRKNIKVIQEEGINRSHIIIYIVDINDEYAEFKVRLMIQSIEFNEKQIIVVIGNKNDIVSIYASKNREAIGNYCSIRKYIFKAISCSDTSKNEIEDFVNNKIIKQYLELNNN